MKNDIKFSLIMPIYNSAATLDDAISSLIRQKYGCFELILVDDCSSDGSYEIAQKYSEGNRNIMSFRMSGNKGSPYCMNFGIKKAKYDWIGIVDSDALENEDHLVIVNKGIEEHIQVIGGKVKFDQVKGYFGKVFYYIESTQFPEMDEIYNKENYEEPPIMGCNFFFLKKVFNKVGGFNENFRAGYDRLFLCDAIENGFNVKYQADSIVNHPLYQYRSLSDIFRRSFIFNKWRVAIIKKSPLIYKKYRLINYLLIVLALYIVAGIIFLGLLNLSMLTGILILGICVYYIFSSHFRKCIPFKYTYGLLLVETIKKIIGVFVYLFRLKPDRAEWKDR